MESSAAIIDPRIQDLINDFDSRPNKASSLPCQFYKKPVFDRAATKEKNYPVYNTEIYARINVDPYTVLDQPILITQSEDMNLSHISKYTVDVERRDRDFTAIWAENWKRFLAGQTDQVIGFRLEAFFANDPGKAETYKHLGILTVEQLAIAPESTIRMIPSGLSDRALAESYLEKMQQSRPINESHQLIEGLKQQLEREKEKSGELAEQMRMLNAKLNDFLSGNREEAPKRKAGRPRKIQEEQGE